MISLKNEQHPIQDRPRTLANTLWICGDYFADQLECRDAAAGVGMSITAFQRFVASLEVGAASTMVPPVLRQVVPKDQRILLGLLDDDLLREMARIHHRAPSVVQADASNGCYAVERSILTGLGLVTLTREPSGWTYKSNLHIGPTSDD